LSQWIPDNLAGHEAVIEPVVQSEPEPVAYVPQFKFRSMTEDVAVAVPEVEPEVPITPKTELIMASTLTAGQIFGQLATLIESNIFTNALPVINTALGQLAANPQEVLNPLNSGIFAAQFIANLTATLPAIEQEGVQGAVQLLQALLTAAQAKVAAATSGAGGATPVTPASVGAAIAAAV
jgi:hypothetical protein